MNFIKNPNLPEKNVKFAICDCRVGGDIISELTILGINPIFTCCLPNLDYPISGHPDMQIIHLGKGEFLSVDGFLTGLNDTVKDNIVCEKFNNRQVKKTLRVDYPEDVLLNAVIIGEYLICNAKTVCSELLSVNKKIINVNQGYTKCSVAVIANEAIITDDTSVYNAVKDKLDVLLIPHGSVKLNGYGYGFIGGACGKISKNELAFYGNIKSCKEYQNIKNFCSNHNVECISLSNMPLYDYGTLIPVIEE